MARDMIGSENVFVCEERLHVGLSFGTHGKSEKSYGMIAIYAKHLAIESLKTAFSLRLP